MTDTDTKAVDSKPADEAKLSKHQLTIDVDHPGSHQPTDDQLTEAIKAGSKDAGHPIVGPYEYVLRINQSGGPSKVEFAYHSKG